MTAQHHARSFSWTNLTLLAGSVLLVLVAGEVATRALFPAPLPWLYPQLRYRPDPRLIFTMVPGQHSFSANVPVRINERGFRGRIFPYSRQPGIPRLLFLGDSIIFGYGLPEEQVTSSLVARLLDVGEVEVESINAGVPAYNTGQETALLEAEGLRYSPDWVILGFCWNDLSAKSGVSVGKDGNLIAAGGHEISGWGRVLKTSTGYALRNLLKKSRLLYSISTVLLTRGNSRSSERATGMRSDILSGTTTPRIAQGWEEVARSLRRLQELSHTHHFRILVVAYPMLASLEESHPMSSYPSRLAAMCERDGLPFLDLEPVFREHYRGRESLFLPYDPDHPNAKGHALAAEAVTGHLKSLMLEAASH